MDTKQAAADLRNAYKAKGWTARMISVRTEYFSMGSAVNVSVKDAAVDFDEAERLAHEICESISRCEITGDILGGGNTYVSVRDRRPEPEPEIDAETEAYWRGSITAQLAKKDIE